MNKAIRAAMAATLCCIVSPSFAANPDEARIAEERVLGVDEQTWRQEHLPFWRKLNASGVVAGSLMDSVEAAGVPAPAMVEVLKAFATALDLKRDVKDGDRFWLRYEQEFAIEGNPIGTGRVLWAELRSSGKGTVALHRFRLGRSAREPFWFASGQGTETSSLRLPLDTINVSSGFGLRADPFDQPSAAQGLAMGQLRAPALPPSLKAKSDGALENVNVATPLGVSLGLSPGGASPRSPALGLRSMVMHSGVDFVADPGTPVHAAADGVIIGAHYKGPYGNWIEIDHDGKLSTVYGHLSGYAPGIHAGVRVEQGQLIGYVGSTGRSTGAHLHFELLVDGRAVNPVGHPSLKQAQLKGPDLERFREVVAADLAEAEREGKPK